MSIALGKPIDSSVAVTGAIGLNGEVDPVGGVYHKAAYALSRPDIQTLIFPATGPTMDEITILFESDPDIFAGKHLILATDMDQVLRQALGCYDPRKVQADRIIVEALHNFGRGEDLVAANQLKQAYKLTPENAVITIWYNLIRSASRP